MKATIQVISTLSLLTLVSALPANNNLSRRQTSSPSSVQICTGENYTGNCETLIVAPETCYTIPDIYKGNVGSLLPEPGLLCRITYTQDTCSLHGDAFVDNTGAPDLHHFVDPSTGDVVDAGAELKAFLCQPCSACT